MLITTSKHPNENTVHIAKLISGMFNGRFLSRGKKHFMKIILSAIRFGEDRILVVRDNSTLDVCKLDYDKRMWSWVRNINIVQK